MLGTPDETGGIDGDNLTNDQPVKKHANASQMLHDRGRGIHLNRQKWTLLPLPVISRPFWS